MKDKEFLSWLKNRLHYRHGEPLGTDYMLKLEVIIDSMDDQQETVNVVKTNVVRHERFFKGTIIIDDPFNPDMDDDRELREKARQCMRESIGKRLNKDV